MTDNKQNVLYIFKNPRFPLWKITLIVAGIWIAYFFILWGIIIYYPKPLVQAEGAPTLPRFLKDDFILSYFLSFVVTSLFFYAALNIFYYASVLKQTIGRYIMYVLSFIGLQLLYSFFHHLLFPKNSKNASDIVGPNYVFFLFLGLLFIAVAYALIIFFMVHVAISKDEKQRNRELLERNNQLEIEKLKAEYNFLKAQINPHFLHNSLNFLYARSLPFSPELSEGILTISEIMRYALMNDADSEGRVMLSKEVDHIRNIIKMNQLRFENKLHIKFEIHCDIAGVKILPLVLITMVENAFKHGDVHDAAFPLTITLNLQNGMIAFSCLNKKKTGPKDMSFGIGLVNTKKRLEMFYEGSAELSIVDNHDSYGIALKIPY